MEDGLGATVFIMPRWAFKRGALTRIWPELIGSGAVRKSWPWVAIYPEKLIAAGQVGNLYLALKPGYAIREVFLDEPTVWLHFSKYNCTYNRKKFEDNDCLCVRISIYSSEYGFHKPFKADCLNYRKSRKTFGGKIV